jgi:hypothetical protein
MSGEANVCGAHEDVAQTAVQKTQPTFGKQWVEVMLTSSTAEHSRLCADYEIGLQLAIGRS